MRVCWCGNTDFSPFGAFYGKCRVCGTSVLIEGMSPEQSSVREDESGYYGKRYWFEGQRDEYGYPDIATRARNDLCERNVYWLRTLLKYRLPPAAVLELGCAHGSFVALMKQAGFTASGVEMSPWVVAFAEKTFGVRVGRGPIESLDVPYGSLDVIVAMDVLEHLPDPTGTMRHCIRLLKPDGLLLIQTPRLIEGVTYEALIESKDRFLEQLKSGEHIYLFSKESVTELFRQLSAPHIHFEPAFFAHYDMFFVVSRAPLRLSAQEDIDAVLLSAPPSRITLAMLDLARLLQESEADRSARLEQITELTRLLQESEADRSARLEQITELTGLLQRKSS